MGSVLLRGTGRDFEVLHRRAGEVDEGDQYVPAAGRATAYEGFAAAVHGV